MLTVVSLLCYTMVLYEEEFTLWLRPSAILKRTKIINLTTPVSRTLNILCIMLKIIAFYTLIVQLYVKVLLPFH